MSSPFNLSPWFTIVLTRISSVFEELIQGQPSWIPSRGHPISFAYAHICMELFSSSETSGPKGE